MKKLFLILLVLSLVLTSVFANQKTYRLSSDEVQDYLILRKVSSSITPDPTFPITASQLTTLVKSLDTSDFTEEYVKLYDELLAKLEAPKTILGSKEIGIGFEPYILGAEYIKANDMNTYDILPYKDRTPFVSLQTTAYMTDNFTGYIDLDIRRALCLYEGDKDLSIITKVLEGEYPLNFPNTAYASVGNDKINFTIGRDRLGNGNGFTGNLQFGENLVFEDFMKLSFVSPKLSYDCTIDTIPMEWNNAIRLNGLKKNIFSHRISFAFTKNFNFTMYEGALTYSPTLTDLEFLNPFMVFHNIGSYYDASTNNFVGFEFVAKLPKQFQLSGQIFIDQICFDEGAGALGSGENAFAALLNASKSMPLWNGIIDFYGEAVYGTPQVYLKNNHGYGINNEYTDGVYTFGTYKYGTSYPVGEKNSDGYYPYNPRLYDYVAALSTQINEACPDVQYIGYKYGGDLFSIGAGAHYENKNLNVNASLQLLAKGDYGIREDAHETRCAEGRADYDWDSSKAAYALVGEHKVQTTAKAFIGADYSLFNGGINLSAKVAALCHFNYQHKAGTKLDLQYAGSITVNPLAFFNK